MFSKIRMKKSTEDYSDNIKKLKKALLEADTIVIGAGAGLSTAAGYTYSGERFLKYFSDFTEKYGIQDMYSGGFYPFPSAEVRWAWWSRHIWLNRYAPIPNDVYSRLLDIVQNKEYFVLTTNVDHCFQRAGFDKKRLFYTQGDYGLFQCGDPCDQKTCDNEEQVKKMILAQGFQIETDGNLIIPAGVRIQMEVPPELVPYCPDCGKEMAMNLRADDSFVEDAGWHQAAGRYSDFIRRHENGKVLYLELGVGMNTPVIIKYPFWQYTAENQNAIYACLNKGEAYVPDEIAGRSICIDGDIAQVLAGI